MLIIAEVGINHNGNLEVAKKLIDVAKDCGCDAVKFQKRTTDIVYTQEFLDSPRESPWGTTQRAQKEGLEFNEAQYDEIDRYCIFVGIPWFASAWDIPALTFLDKYDCWYQKVASAMLTNKDFMTAVANRVKHTFISTGMADYGIIDNALTHFRWTGTPFELMHCVSTYPMRDEDANLMCIPQMRKRFNCDVGYSGHETGVAISTAAAALGISSLERHITLDKSMYGSDQAASIEPAGLRQLVGAVRKVEKAMGDGRKEITDEEKKIVKKLRYWEK